MSENVEKVINYYQDCNEDKRMENNMLEFIRCKEIIQRYLDKKHLSILDIGGATGAFSFWLAKQGHRVSLVDFAPKHIKIAKEREEKENIKLKSAIVGDARNLPYDDDYFDLVLLMGPLYHLTDKSDRIKSLKEAYRVLKPNGKIIVEVISKYASMVDGFTYGLVDDPEFIPIMNRDIETGLHKDTSSSNKYFTDAYFHHPKEVGLEIEEAEFLFEELIAVTSFGCTIADVNEKIKDEKYRKVLLDTIKQVETESSLMGISSHYMGIGKKNK